MVTSTRPNSRSSTHEKLFNTLLTTLILTIASFNVRGLSNVIKQEELGADCEKFNIDILAIQETKIHGTASFERILPTNHKLLVFEQKNRHGGLGFVIAKKMVPYVVTWKCISDRVAYLDISIPTKSDGSFMCRFVNAYCPHTKLAKKNPNLLRDFYNHLNIAVSVPARWDVYTMGDFNSKLGKLSTDDVQNGLSSYMGKYGNGTRNENGESLLNFIISNDFFTCNTAFQHKSSHVTTYTGTIHNV